MQSILIDTAAVGRGGVWVDRIDGRYCKITVHQLAMAWWCYQAGHITRRQLRVWFAAHEMRERRRYTKDATRKPLYGLDEIKALVGGRGSKKADLALAADIRALARLGLVGITDHAIQFAVSIDQIAVDDVSGFWAFFDNIPNRSRSVSVPRRTCRAMAAGFSSAVTAMMIALMIRSLFWHRPGRKVGQGGYRVDGRTKCAWVADVFGISRRAVTTARARLIELGWITAIEAPQWQLNKWGQRYAINVDAFGPEAAAEQGGDTGESASPSRAIPTDSSSPCLNSSSSSSMNLKTRKPAPKRSEPSGVPFGTKGSRKKKLSPVLSNITAEDLRDTGRLMELHRQAIDAGYPVCGEAGRLDFVALAERAMARGEDPPRMFAWLLRNQKFMFITLADEDAASARLRMLRDGPRDSSRGVEDHTGSTKPIELTEDDKVVLACLQTAQKHRIRDPFTIARQVKHWTRDHWDTAHAAYLRKQKERGSRPCHQ